MFVLRKRLAQFVCVDGSVLVPERLKDLTVEHLRRIPVAHLDGQCSLDSLFECEQWNGPADVVVLVGDCREVESLGAGMASGVLVVVGDVGRCAGSRMKGGSLAILGNTGERCAEGLFDGTVYIDGSCADRLGAPMPGMKSGVRGGDIIVTGNVGSRAFERMRRGTALLAGDVDSHLAPQMIAGTIVVFGQVGETWGGGLRRGSLVFAQDQSAESAASWSEPRDFELSFLPLVWKQLQRTLSSITEMLSSIASSARERQDKALVDRIDLGQPNTKLSIPSTRWVERQIGDLNNAGRGEVLTLRRVSTEGSNA